MKWLRKAKQFMLLSVVTGCFVFLASCQTANSTSKAKGKPHAAPQNATAKAGLYRAMAEQLTKQCPLKIDEVTTLIKVQYKEEQHALAYTYLMTHGVYEDMNKQGWNVVQKAIESMLKEQLKANQLMYQIRADGLTLVYIYTDKNNTELCSVTLHPGEY